MPAAGTADETAPEPAGKFAERTRRNHTLVHALRAEGRGLREIARHLSWGLHTVQRYDRAGTWQELVDGRWKAPRASKLDPFKPYLDQHAGQGHGSFTRLFRRETGMSFADWRQQACLSVALPRLAEGVAVTAVALDLGYDSPASFSTMFKRVLGVSPSRYRP